MSKQSVDWHLKCLNAMREILIGYKEKINILNKDCERLSFEIEEYRVQIESANQKKLPGFDRERFGKKIKEK